MRNVIVVVIVLLVTAATCLAGGPSSPCTLAGTWYGGSPDAGAPYYQMTFTPITGNRFATRGQFAPEIASMGYLSATDWTGDETKVGPNTYKGYIMAMFQWNPDSTLRPPTADPMLPELDFIPYTIQMLDCNTFQGTIRHWYVYYNFTNDITPLSKRSRPPDAVMDFDPPIVEVYRRAPDSCPGCPFATTPSSATAAPASRLGKALPRR